ncbi:ABC transporter permease subunit [Halosimplex amylolyticum]|uniref:ABC transporter permease subunit n=1 Tax=Halosimplex amylolyticum TaxID=3396616 RepID=UPI003F54C979
MSVRAVAHKDFLDVRRAKIVWAAGGAYTALTALFFLQVRLGSFERASDDVLALWNVVFVGAVFVPAVALVAAYLAIAGERESGSIKHLLSTPVSRRDVVLGKYLSRAGVVAASLALAFAVAAALASVWFGPVRWRAFVGIAALTTVYALAYVSVAIAISAATATRSRAMLGALGFYFSTNLMALNDDVSGLAGVEYVLRELLGVSVDPELIQFLGVLTNPTRAYLFAATAAFPEELTEAMEIPVPADPAWYLRPEVALGLLLAWLVVPAAFGIRRFERADID